ncbi:MAG: hypothetical protein ACI95C_000196 [Pseudohongiellaceae bacterium]|jgi:hypothetical protein
MLVFVYVASETLKLPPQTPYFQPLKLPHKKQHIIALNDIQP